MKNILLIALSVLSLIAYGQKKKNKKLSLEQQVEQARKQQAEAQAHFNDKPLTLIGAKLPTFNVLTSKELLFFDTSAAKNKPLILALFNPGCDHCLTAAKQFYAQRERFKDATVLFVTGNNLWGNLKEFMEIGKINLEGIDNFVIAADHSDVLKDLFEYSGIPQVMIYNKDKILTQKYYQDISIDSVIHYMNK